MGEANFADEDTSGCLCPSKRTGPSITAVEPITSESPLARTDPPTFSRQAAVREKCEYVASDTPLQSETLGEAGQASSNLCARLHGERLIKHHHVFSNRPHNRQIVVGAPDVPVHLPSNSRALREGEDIARHMAVNIQRLAEDNEVPIHRAIDPYPALL